MSTVQALTLYSLGIWIVCPARAIKNQDWKIWYFTDNRIFLFWSSRLWRTRSNSTRTPSSEVLPYSPYCTVSVQPYSPYCTVLGPTLLSLLWRTRSNPTLLTVPYRSNPTLLTVPYSVQPYSPYCDVLGPTLLSLLYRTRSNPTLLTVPYSVQPYSPYCTGIWIVYRAGYSLISLRCPH